MRGIIFNCIDNFGKNYKFVAVCAEDKVDETIKKCISNSTEIIGHEIVYAIVND